MQNQLSKNGLAPLRFARSHVEMKTSGQLLTAPGQLLTAPDNSSAAPDNPVQFLAAPGHLLAAPGSSWAAPGQFLGSKMCLQEKSITPPDRSDGEPTLPSGTPSPFCKENKNNGQRNSQR